MFVNDNNCTKLKLYLKKLIISKLKLNKPNLYILKEIIIRFITIKESNNKIIFLIIILILR